MNADGHRSKLGQLTRICVWASLCTVLLFSTGCAEMEGVASFGKRLYDYARGDTPIVAAKGMYNSTVPDDRRVGINKLSDRDFGRKEPYTDRYRELAQLDKDWLVRATAIRALNRSRDTGATAIFIKALSDENAIVRVEACKALVHMPDPAAAPGLIKLVNDDQDRDVRIWAADALQHYRTLEVARTLAGQLRGREFGVAWQSHRSLVNLTGQDMSYDENAWLSYLTSTQNPFG